MYRTEHIETKTKWGLRREIRKLKEKHPELLVLEKRVSVWETINPRIHKAVVRYDDGTPIPEALDEDRFVSFEFYYEDQRRSFLDNQSGMMNHYWLQDGKNSDGKVIWKVIFEL